MMIGLLMGGMVTGAVAKPVVSALTAKQRFPWNGWVDVSCTVSGIQAGEEWVFSVTAVEKTSQKAVSTRNVRFDATNGVFLLSRTISDGDYHLCWDAEKDLGKDKIGNYTLRVTAEQFTHGRVQLWENGPYWATTNLGADYPDEAGDYFFWGDTNGCKRVGNNWIENGTGNTVLFNSTHCPTYNKNKDTLQSSRVIDADGNLMPAYDAAAVKWREDWRMPTSDEMEGLLDNCNWLWTTENGVPGYRVSGKGAYSAASIFLPAAGAGDGTSLDDPGSYGAYWSASVNPSYSDGAYGFGFDAGDRGWSSYYDRDYGQSVRPVAGFTELGGALVTGGLFAAEVNLPIDTRTGVRTVAPGESVVLTYSPLWDGSASATVTKDGAVQVDGARTADVFVWTPPENAAEGTRWTFTHTTANSSMTAQFVTKLATLSVTGEEPCPVWCHGAVTVTAPAYTGFAFVRWEVETTASDWMGVPDEAEVSFLMPNADLTLTAIYKWATEIKNPVVEKNADGTVRIAWSVPGAVTQPAEAAWGEDVPTFTEADEYSVWYEVVIWVENEAHETEALVAYRHEAVVIIDKRTLEVSSGTGSWSYDGATHKDTYLGVAGDGLAPGETLDLAAPSTEITNVGTKENTPGEATVWRGEGAARRNTTANYIINKVEGTLTMTTADNPFARGETIDRDTPAGAVSTYDRVAVYNGEAWTIDEEALTNDVRNAVYEALRVNGTWKVEYWNAQSCALTEQPPEDAVWSETVPGFVDAGEYVVWYRVVDTAGNCEAWAHAAQVTIAKRPVTVRSASGVWAEDGEAHSAATVTADGLVEGHTVEAGGFGSVSAIGKAANTFTVSAIRDAEANDVTANYEVVTSFGVLSVRGCIRVEIPAGTTALVALPFGMGEVAWREAVATDGLPDGVLIKIPMGDAQGRYAGYALAGGEWMCTTAADGLGKETVMTGDAVWVTSPAETAIVVTLLGEVDPSAPAVRIGAEVNLVGFLSATEVTLNAQDWTGESAPDAAGDMLQLVDDATGELVTYVFRSGKWVNTKLAPPADPEAKEAMLNGFKVKAAQGMIYRRAAGAMVLPGGE